MDYFIFFYLSSMIWLEPLCSHFIYPFTTWYELSSFYLFVPWLDMDCYCFYLLSWFDMDCNFFYFLSMTWYGLQFFTFYLFSHDMIWMATIFLFYPDLIWYFVVYCPMTWYGLTLYFISFPHVDNMFPIRFIWLILG